MGYTKRKITLRRRIKCLLGKHYFVYQAHGHGASWHMCEYCPAIKRNKDKV